MSDLVISKRSGLAFINVRGDAASALFCDSLESVIGAPLPVEPNTCVAGAAEACWLGPDEWLLLLPDDQASEALVALGNAFAGEHVAVNDVSGGYVALQIEGRNGAELLSKGCTLDFYPGRFGAGTCAQSGLAKAPVLIARQNDGDVFDIVIRTSFADYLGKWLAVAGQDLGIEFR